MTYTASTDYSLLLKSVKGSLKKRTDINADFRSMGRRVTSEFELEYAINESRIPRSIVDFYATGCNGLHAWWWPVGSTAGPQVGGYARLPKLDKLRWQKLGDTTTEIIWLHPDETDLLLVRSDAVTRIVHPIRPMNDGGLLTAIDLGSPEEFLLQWLELGFPHPSLWNTPVIDAQREMLAAKPTKIKLDVGARAWAKKSRTSDNAHSERGEVSALQKGSNDKKYAEVVWDHGRTTWIRAGLLVALDDDRFESEMNTPVSSKTLSSLCCWLQSNSFPECFVSRPQGTIRYRVSAASWWLAKIFASTPLEKLVNEVTDWVGARDVSTINYEKIDSAVYSFDTCQWTDTFNVQRAAQAVKDAVILCWLREPSDDPAPSGLHALQAQVLSADPEEDLGASLAEPGPRTVANSEPFEDNIKRGEDLGLPGPVGYYHD